MTKLVTAEYDADQRTLLLEESLDGVQNHARVQLQVITPENVAEPQRPWMALSGSLSKEAGEELAQIMDEMFPPWND